MLLSAAGLIVIAFFLWRNESAAYDTQTQIANNPDQHQGSIICTGFLIIKNKQAGIATGMDKRGIKYRLHMDTEKVFLNERYSFRGQISGDGSLRVISYQHHPYRFLKYLVSASSLFIIIYLLIVHIRFNTSSLCLIVVNPNKGLFAWKKDAVNNA